SVSL
ncbi:hypothetical protein D039_0132B, partial [Vibrio parahaemolyticus EKP-028]